MPSVKIKTHYISLHFLLSSRLRLSRFVFCVFLSLEYQRQQWIGCELRSTAWWVSPFFKLKPRRLFSPDFDYLSYFFLSRLKLSSTVGSRCSAQRTERDMSRSNCLTMPQMTPTISRMEALRPSCEHFGRAAGVPAAAWSWESCWSFPSVC